MPVRLIRAASFVIAAALALALAPPAFAHAELLRTQPREGAVTSGTPRRVVLVFDEPVETSLGSLHVYDGAGNRVDRGKPVQPAPERVQVNLERVLARGTYTVAWRVVSEDSDPVNGAFVFHVERPGPHPGGIAAEVLVDTPTSVTVAYDTARFLEYVLVILCAGGALALAAVLGSAAPAIRRRLFATMAVLALALAVLSLLELVLQGAAAGALALADAFRWDVVDSVARTRFGEVATLRAAIALVLAVVAAASARRGGRRERVALALALALLATPVAVSHASVTGALATLADATHISAAAAWIGGLAFTAAALVLARTERWGLAARAVPRFSKLAVVAVAVLIAAGVVNAYLQIRSWGGLWETTYGRLVLAKIALLTPLLGLGAFNNRYAVPHLRRAIATVGEQRRFLRAISVELALMTAILAVTAVLVSAPPARTQHGGGDHPQTGQVQFGPYGASVRVTPARAGANTVRVDFGHSEIPVTVHVASTLDARAIGPLRAMLRHVTHPTFVGQEVQFPLPGVWSLRVEAQRSETELYTTTIRVRIAPSR